MKINENFSIVQDSGEGVGYIVIERKTITEDGESFGKTYKKGDLSTKEYKSYFSSLYEALRFLYMERIPLCKTKTIYDCLKTIQDFEKTLLDAISSAQIQQSSDISLKDGSN